MYIMSSFIDDYVYTFEYFSTTREKEYFCSKWHQLILSLTGEDINRAFWEDVPVIARIAYLKVFRIKNAKL
jgi:hypothetical protein